MDFRSLRFRQSYNSQFKLIKDLDELFDITDDINAQYSFLSNLDSTSNEPILYINGSILDNEISHTELINIYADNKEQYKKEWIIDISKIDINIETINKFFIPCARLVFSMNKKVIELLTYFACDPKTVAKAVANKYKCKVYTFFPDRSLLIRHGNKKS